MPPRKRPTPPRAERPPAEPPPDETRAHDLLPPDPPRPPPPRKVGARRVVGHGLSERLLARRGWRPAGNSRRFWSKIEDDDPFLPRPPGSPKPDDGAVGYSVGSSHDVYAADRLDRNPSRSPKPSRASGTHTPDTRSAPAPDIGRSPAASSKPVQKPAPPPRPAQPSAPRPSPPPKPAPEPAPPPPPLDRRPPRIVPNEGQRSSGRVPVGGNTAKPGLARHQLVDAQGRAASEVRKEVEETRAKAKPPPPPTRSLDEILGLLGELRMQEQLHREGKLDDIEPEPPPRPTPRPNPAPKPSPTPTPRAPPPKPAAPARASAPAEEDDEDLPPPPVNRSPSAAANNGGSLDDLFGSGETRVRIGKRTLPKPKPDEGG